MVRFGKMLPRYLDVEKRRNHSKSPQLAGTGVIESGWSTEPVQWNPENPKLAKGSVHDIENY
jgi:hypothetical protein